jgi:LmbE family N-acetylglucosaminyl deacetylase
MDTRDPDTRDLGTILAVWAHPDDETYLAGGLMAAAAGAGQRVVVVTATRGGSGGDPRHRSRELRAALDVLGVREQVHLDFPDGGCEDVPVDLAVRRLRLAMAFVRPDTVVTFGPDGLTGHPDHVAVSRWVTAAWRSGRRAARLLYATVTPAFVARFGAVHARHDVFAPGLPTPTEPPDLAVDLALPPELVDRKRAALAAHASQTAQLAAAMGERTYREWWARESFVEPARAAALAASA